MATGKQWGGRFENKTDALMEQLGESVSFDARLAPWDIRASMAHADMLGARGIIPLRDAKKIVQGLKAIGKEIAAGTFTWNVSLEDVHTNIEVALVERIGDAGKRLHTGRSRNDQVSTDVRLWARDQVDAIIRLLHGVQTAFLHQASKHLDTVMPGYTHMQHAQPVLLAHHLLAYFEMFSRDRQRFTELRARINVMPLGSAAMAGTTFPIDRKQVAEALGFDAISANSMDAVSDRDYLIEFCSAASITMMHLSRLCEELVLWSSSEFGFIEISDAFTTGSSIMPQKKNPDAAELIRGKTGRVYGDLVRLLTLMKGLPLTYNRDMQEDKEAVFDASDTVQLSLAVVARMMGEIAVDKDRALNAAREGFMEATDLADALVRRGMPFREAHGVVGRLVVYCVKNGKRLTDLTLDEFRVFSELFDEAVVAGLEPSAIIGCRNVPGGTARRQVAIALKQAEKKLKASKLF